VFTRVTNLKKGKKIIAFGFNFPRGDDLYGLAIRVNQWWKRRYSDFKKLICKKKIKQLNEVIRH